MSEINFDDLDSGLDVLIVGGGPAGAAAAIICAQHGLKVQLLEREGADHVRPGETLHPGVAPLLAQLGMPTILDEVSAARHAGVWIEWGDAARRFQAFGGENADGGADDAWLGYHVQRAQLDTALLDRARVLGVKVLLGQQVGEPLLENGVVCGAQTMAGPIAARLVIDASGRARWLGRALGINSPASSPPLVARFGYVTGECPERDEAPLLCGDAKGWTWTARVQEQVYQWTHVALDGSKLASDWLPPEFRGLTRWGSTRGADVTWRLAEEPAGPGWFLAGDAAAMLDPCSSHGILKAMMSGMAVAQLAYLQLRREAPALETAHVYRDWLAGWFANDVAQLREFYQTLGVGGFERGA